MIDALRTILLDPFRLAAIASALLLLHGIGLVLAIRAIQTTRTAQGAVGWAISLVTWPLIAIPLYWVFGRSRFHGYLQARKASKGAMVDLVETIKARIEPFRVDLGSEFAEARVLEQLVHLPFTSSNRGRLLIDGDATFEAIFAAVDNARSYLLIQFYIVNDDTLGQELKKRLIDKARAGVRVYFLYDELGSKRMTRHYLADLTAAGIPASAMNTTRGSSNRFQLNFRNHRKIVVADGERAFIGGLNVGDEYLHRHPELSPWRDTHLELEGPAVLAAQLTFFEDWFWATGTLPEVSFQAVPSAGGNQTMFVLPSGPVDDFETCGLAFTHAVNSADRRIWIATPYFVPDPGMIQALQLAVLRGVEVRVLIPGLADHLIARMVALSFVEKMTDSGVAMYQYGAGFMHQKVLLIDEDLASVGTMNFDNRSFRLNFEISVLVYDTGFASRVAEMLEQDFARSELLPRDTLAKRSPAVRLLAQVARLFSPVL